MSQFKVSALKYRPQRFEDVVGQKHVTDTLKNALNRNQLAHALLFCGPRGVGKTTCARILAKALNCKNPTADLEPCNECEMCKAMNNNASLNIAELDAASNNSVEHIRTLNEQVRIRPMVGDYSVYIIDEVHMLTTSAFNAFLKTLEEPPSYAYFILATTEKHKIIPTILSRCQIYDFKRIEVKDIRDHLAFIAEKEGVEADKDALHLIAMKADGALRDSLSIFDRIVSATGSRITYEDVVNQLHILDYDYFFAMTDALIAEDVPSVFKIFDDIIRYGFQPDHFLNGLGSHMRDLLMCQYKDTQGILEFGESLKERYIKQAEAIDTTFLVRSMHIINQADTRYQRAKNKRLHVEMALSHICFSSRYDDKEITTGDSLKKKRPDTGEVRQEAQAEAPTKPVAPVKEDIASVKDDTTPAISTEKVEATESINPVEQTSIIEDPQPKEEITSRPNAETSTSSQKLRAPDIPSLSSLDALRTMADKSLREREENRIDLTQANLDEFMKKLLQNIESASTETAIKSSRFVLTEDQDIKVLIGSRTDGTIIKNDCGILSELRSYFLNSEINLLIEINKELQAKRIADKPLTPREALEKLNKENPKVLELQQKLDLKIIE